MLVFYYFTHIFGGYTRSYIVFEVTVESLMFAIFYFQIREVAATVLCGHHGPAFLHINKLIFLLLREYITSWSNTSIHVLTLVSVH